MYDTQALTDAILQQAHELEGKKQLTCAEAFELARRFKAERIEVGRICNQHGVRIRKCQLGCFP